MGASVVPVHGQLHLNRHIKVVIRNIAVLVQEVRCYAHIAGANEIQISESVRRQIFRSGNPTGNDNPGDELIRRGQGEMKAKPG